MAFEFAQKRLCFGDLGGPGLGPSRRSGVPPSPAAQVRAASPYTARAPSTATATQNYTDLQAFMQNLGQLLFVKKRLALGFRRLLKGNLSKLNLHKFNFKPLFFKAKFLWSSVASVFVCS